MRIVVKVGGAILDEDAARERFALSVRAALDDGHELVLVHGGGAQLTRHASALGLETQRVRGLRVTDPEMMRAALQVLAGEVNARLIAALTQVGVRAIGLTGADAGLMRAVRRDPTLGHVGEVVDVDRGVLDDLVSASFVPVVATVAHSDRGFLNVNADEAVAPIARAFDAKEVLFLFDAPFVRGEGGAELTTLDPVQSDWLVSSGAIAGGMIPKVGAAFAALAGLDGDAAVRAGSGLRRDAVRALLAGEGTTFERTTGFKRASKPEESVG